MGWHGSLSSPCMKHGPPRQTDQNPTKMAFIAVVKRRPRLAVVGPNVAFESPCSASSRRQGAEPVTRRAEEWGLTGGRLYWPRLPAITGTLAQPSSKSHLEVGQSFNRWIRRRWDRFEHPGSLLNSSHSFCLSVNLRHIDCDRPARPRNPSYSHTLRMSI